MRSFVATEPGSLLEFVVDTEATTPGQAVTLRIRCRLGPALAAWSAASGTLGTVPDHAHGRVRQRKSGLCTDPLVCTLDPDVRLCRCRTLVVTMSWAKCTRSAGCDAGVDLRGAHLTCEGYLTSYVARSYLASYERHGMARVQCVEGCTCPDSQFNSLWERHNSQVGIAVSGESFERSTVESALSFVRSWVLAAAQP